MPRKPRLALPVGFQYRAIFSNEVLVVPSEHSAPIRPCVQSSSEEAGADDEQQDDRSKHGHDTQTARDEAKNRWKRTYDMSRKFQSAWTEEYEWAEAADGPEGPSSRTLCKACTWATGKRVTMAAKLDTMQKHAGWIKQDGVRVGVSEACAHLKHEAAYNEHFLQQSGTQRSIPASLAQGRESVVSMKVLQFSTLFDCMSRGRPMNEYTTKPALLRFNNTPRIPSKHWSENSGWGMAEVLADVIVEHQKEVAAKSAFVSTSLDEVTDRAGQQRLCTHIYVVDESFQRTPIFLSLDQVQGCPNAKNITDMLLENICTYSGLTHEQLAERLVCVACDGASVMSGELSGVARRVREGTSPFAHHYHCAAHRTSLAAGVLNDNEIIASIEAAVKFIYKYFKNSPKRRGELAAAAVVSACCLCCMIIV